MLCDVMHDYHWIFNPEAGATNAEKTLLRERQATFSFVYLFVEAASLTFGAYYILMYNKMLSEEYKYTNWGWKFIIFGMLMLLANW